MYIYRLNQLKNLKIWKLKSLTDVEWYYETAQSSSFYFLFIHLILSAFIDLLNACYRDIPVPVKQRFQY